MQQRSIHSTLDVQKSNALKHLGCNVLKIYRKLVVYEQNCKTAFKMCIILATHQRRPDRQNSNKQRGIESRSKLDSLNVALFRRTDSRVLEKNSRREKNSPFVFFSPVFPMQNLTRFSPSDNRALLSERPEQAS